jgi:hypothetical protein
MLSANLAYSSLADYAHRSNKRVSKYLRNDALGLGGLSVLCLITVRFERYRILGAAHVAPQYFLV